MKVFLEKHNKRIELKPHMVKLFRKEFKRATNIFNLICRSENGYLEEVAADVKVIMEHSPNRSEELFILSRAVLYRPRRNRSYQFYFGFQLIEWFKDAIRP